VVHVLENRTPETEPCLTETFLRTGEHGGSNVHLHLISGMEKQELMGKITPT